MILIVNGNDATSGRDVIMSRLYPFAGGVGEQFAEVREEWDRYFLTFGVFSRQH